MADSGWAARLSTGQRDVDRLVGKPTCKLLALDGFLDGGEGRFQFGSEGLGVSTGCRAILFRERPEGAEHRRDLAPWSDPGALPLPQRVTVGNFLQFFKRLLVDLVDSG
jgi:hypothetical protein